MKEKDAKFSEEQLNSQNEDFGINTDENMSGGINLDNRLEDEVEKLQEEVQLQKDKYLRLFADFDNLKKRTAREKLETMQTAGKEIITSLLDVLDDCDRAEKQLQSAGDINQVKEGVQLVFNKLKSVLQNKGLKAMESCTQILMWKNMKQ